MKKLLLLASLAVAGCAYPGTQRVAGLSALVGKTETDVVRAYGVPTRTYDTGGQKFLAYSESHIDTLPGSPGIGFGYGGFGYPYGFGYGGFGPDIIQRDCVTTFELSGGIVKTWSLRGNDCT